MVMTREEITCFTIADLLAYTSLESREGSASMMDIAARAAPVSNCTATSQHLGHMAILRYFLSF